MPKKTTDLNLDFDFDLGMGDLEIDFDLGDFDLDEESDNLKTRVMQPKAYKKNLTQNLKYEHAERLAKEIDISKDSRTFAIVSGNFIFGDFIEALLFHRKIEATKIYVSTLGLSENNIDSLKNATLITQKTLHELNIILSSYFYSHEKHNLVKYLYQELDKANKTQIAFCRSHCKICLIETADKRYFIMHGSANMRSSGNIEQFVFEENKELYDFNKSYMDAILKKYKTINKQISGRQTWQAAAQNTNQPTE